MSRSSAAGPKFLVAVNAFAAIFSLIWLVGHSTERLFDWEFWFALGYLILAAVNLVFWLQESLNNAAVHSAKRRTSPQSHRRDDRQSYAAVANEVGRFLHARAPVGR